MRYQIVKPEKLVLRLLREPILSFCDSHHQFMRTRMYYFLGSIKSINGHNTKAVG